MEMKFKRHFEQGSLKKEFFQRQKTIFTLQLATAATTILHGTWFWQVRKTFNHCYHICNVPSLSINKKNHHYYLHPISTHIYGCCDRFPSHVR